MSERTHEPTPRRRAEFRRRGQTARSAEIGSALILLAGVSLIRMRGGVIGRHLGELMQRTFTNLNHSDLTPVDLFSKGLELGINLFLLMAPFFLVVMAVGVGSNLIQTGWLLTTQPLKPDPKRLNPLTGFRRIFSLQGLMEAAKTLAKMMLVILVAYGTLRGQMGNLAAASTGGLGPGLSVLGNVVYGLSLRIASLLLVLAGLDYLFQRRQFQQRIRMTREELQEELKSAEGQPQLKSKIRQLQRQMARQRMMQQLPMADVVVTNPTHLAVALQYDAETMSAPTVIAKGRGLIAKRIVRKAKEYRVPVVENRPLAQALFQVELGMQIPNTLYQAVAELLVF
ncbi:MAG TPA: flagellar biosynthesis protein FlhB, partial [Anaerolineae bacterium]|nr:flagellar biosynthesis protein FlhB [Anaerolineae bacterium]